MAIARLLRPPKRPHGLCMKMTAIVILGLCFIFVWSGFSPSSSSVTSQRESFDDIAEPVSHNTKIQPEKADHLNKEDSKVVKSGNRLEEKERNEKINGSLSIKPESGRKGKIKDVRKEREKEREKFESEGLSVNEVDETQKEKEEQDGEEGEEEVIDGKEEGLDGESEGEVETEGENDLVEPVDQNNPEEKLEDRNDELKKRGNKRENKGPLFDPKTHYNWKFCNTRSKHNYIPCIDFEVSSGRQQSYRHTERSCPRTPLLCLVPLPREGYESPVPWPESKLKILHKNVAHPKLAAYVKKNGWLVQSEEYLTFPQNQSMFKGGVAHYLEFIEEMVPDIEWGKNIRVVLDMGCTDSSFGASLLDKKVLTLSLGLKDDLVDLAQVALERGFPALVSPFNRRRLPFPSAAFDAIHCGGCSISWHSNGGSLLLEINRILRPGGYFILSTKHDSMEEEEAMTTLTASICWNILAHKTDEVSEVGIKIYQKPESNDIYELRRKKIPPLCKENENPDAAWYVTIKSCLHTIPSSIEQHGTEWPEEWPKRLESFPEWLNERDKLMVDMNRWKAIVEKSYLTGMGIDWSRIRNVMDMKAIYGGFAAALSKQKVWVMNVVPVHAPDTLPVIFDRGLVGVYHDWCESIGTYPRTYDLLHADHLFSRLKNRCKQPVSIVVEMDRILRPGGSMIIRDKVEILNPLEEILRSLHWDIRMTYAQDKEGIICAQKTTWRP